MKKVIIIGAGPAGMMAAYSAASCNASVLLIEQNKILGKKLLITGKGRCNVTNFCSVEELIGQVVTNPKFLYSALNSFTAYEAYAFFEDLGVPLKIERGNRVFPVSDKASDVRNAFKRALDRLKVNIVEDCVVGIERVANVFKVKCKNEVYSGDAVIIATGGISYPLTGSTGDGYRFAASLGHRIVAPSAALVPLLEAGNVCKNLMGLSLKNVQLSLYGCKGKMLYREFGEMIFTHEGISGPIVLSLSSYLKKNDFPCDAEIDLKPALDDETLDKRLLRDFELFSNKEFHNALGKLLPQKLIPIVIERSGINPGIKVHQITKEQRTQLVRIIKHFKMKIKEKGTFSEAIITSGGVDTREIDPKTMQSKLVPGLYFAGEVIDVDALTGGYNLQIAYSTGYLAGTSASKGVLNGN